MLVGADAIKIHSQIRAGLGGDQVETVNYQEKKDSGHHNRQQGGKHLVLTHRALWLWLISCRIQEWTEQAQSVFSIGVTTKSKKPGKRNSRSGEIPHEWEMWLVTPSPEPNQIPDPEPPERGPDILKAGCCETLSPGTADLHPSLSPKALWSLTDNGSGEEKLPGLFSGHH